MNRIKIKSKTFWIAAQNHTAMTGASNVSLHREPIWIVHRFSIFNF